MLKRLLAGIVVAACMVAAWPSVVAGQGGGRGANFPTEKQLAESKEAQKHVAAAMALAKSDLVAEAKAFCTPTGPQRVALARQAAGLPQLEDRPLEPIKIFDNLYYLGFSDVGAWAISTSEGIILMDALNSPDEARDILVPGLKKVGLDPARIKYLVIGHGHNDHTGGASYIQNTYGARVLMGGPDWDMMQKNQRADRPQPKRDMDITDGQKLTLGDTTVTLALTPGHTPGTIAMLLPVKHRGQTHTALIMSGTQMPNQPSLAAFERVFNEARKQKAETALGGHPDILVNKLTVMETLSKGYPTGAHPFLMGEEKFGRYMSIVLECARARVAAQASSAS